MSSLISNDEAITLLELWATGRYSLRALQRLALDQALVSDELAARQIEELLAGKLLPDLLNKRGTRYPYLLLQARREASARLWAQQEGPTSFTKGHERSLFKAAADIEKLTERVAMLELNNCTRVR